MSLINISSILSIWLHPPFPCRLGATREVMLDTTKHHRTSPPHRRQQHRRRHCTLFSFCPLLIFLPSSSSFFFLSLSLSSPDLDPPVIREKSALWGDWSADGWINRDGLQWLPNREPTLFMTLVVVEAGSCILLGQRRHQLMQEAGRWISNCWLAHGAAQAKNHDSNKGDNDQQDSYRMARMVPVFWKVEPLSVADQACGILAVWWYMVAVRDNSASSFPTSTARSISCKGEARINGRWGHY